MSALAEAATLLSGGMIDDCVLHGAEVAFTGLETGAVELLDEPELAEAFRAMRKVVGAGMQEMIRAGAELIGMEEEVPDVRKRVLH